MDSKNRKFLISIQPFLSTYDYKSKDSFFKKIDCVLSKIESKIPSLFNHNYNKIIVLPEMIGVWLAFSNCSDEVYNTRNMIKASLSLVLNYPFQFFKSMIQSIFTFEWLRYGLFNSIKRALFRARSKDVFDIYTDVFSKLSKKYKSYIVAGSTFLPHCVIDRYCPKNIRNTKKGLYNISFVYDPDGNVIMIREKKNLVPNEKFLDSSNDPIKSIRTPLGKLSVVVCADSWSKQVHKELSSLKVDILAIPAFIFPHVTWKSRWNGYTIDEKPDDVDLKDIKNSFENDMWFKYSTPGRLKESNISHSIVSLAHSDLWDIQAGGQSYISNIDGQILAISKEYVNYEDILIYEI